MSIKISHFKWEGRSSSHIFCKTLLTSDHHLYQNESFWSLIGSKPSPLSRGRETESQLSSANLYTQRAPCVTHSYKVVHGKRDSFDQIIAPLVLNIDYAYLDRHGGIIQLYTKIHCIWFLNGITQMMDVFTNSHF